MLKPDSPIVNTIALVSFGIVAVYFINRALTRTAAAAVDAVGRDALEQRQRDLPDRQQAGAVDHGRPQRDIGRGRVRGDAQRDIQPEQHEQHHLSKHQAGRAIARLLAV